MILEREEIKNYLPHREPFLFVDSVEEYERGKSIRARLFLDPNFGFFRGHFPENPIMPGILSVEALAQACGLLVALDAAESGKSGGKPKIFYLASSNVKFKKVVRAGETLELVGHMAKSFGGLSQFSVESLCGGAVAAEGSLVLAEAK